MLRPFARDFIAFIDTTLENYNLIKIRKSEEMILIVS